MGNNEKVNSNKLFCTLKISKGLIEYVQKKIKFFLSQSWQMQGIPAGIWGWWPRDCWWGSILRYPGIMTAAEVSGGSPGSQRESWHWSDCWTVWTSMCWELSAEWKTENGTGRSCCPPSATTTGMPGIWVWRPESLCQLLIWENDRAECWGCLEAFFFLHRPLPPIVPRL